MRALVAVALACALAFACTDEPTGPPGSLSISVAAPSDLPLAVGDKLTLAVDVRDRWGEALPGVVLAWSSSDARIVMVSPEGVVTAVGPGMATVTGSVRGVSGTVQLRVADPEAAVLLSLYLSTNGDDWTHTDNWFVDHDLGTWYGVETDSAGRVIGLDLSENNLDGRIPPRLGGLAHLRKLDLGGNELAGEIPGELGSLANLERLDLSRNELHGHIPAYYDSESDVIGLGVLSNLGWLDLSGNRLDGEIPRELSGLASLERLDLSDNDLWGAIPASNDDGLDALSHLTWLDLSGNQLSGGIPLELGELASLERLDLSENQLTGQIPAGHDAELGSSGLRRLSDLTWLNLSGNQLNGGIPWSLGLLARLETLWLSYNQLEGSLPSELGSLQRLTWLLVGDNALSGALPLELTGLELEVFGYSGTSLCVPDDTSFRTWLDEISNHEGTGMDCAAALSDRDILEILYNATNGPSWVNNENWLSDAPLGEWHGVDTDDSGRVVQLLLAGRYDNTTTEFTPHGLSGPIPPELGTLANLTSLDLSSNRLSGRVPPELGRLANLERLDLEQNSLSGPIPPELGRLANLERLNLYRNSLSGPIPPELGRLANLERLNLYRNSLSSPIPPELGNLASVSYLNVSSNRLTGPIPPELGRLANVTIMSVSRNELTGPIPPELGRLTNLEGLYLYRNNLSGPIPPELGRLANLETLYLYGNNLAGSIPQTFPQLVNLARFDYSSQTGGLCAPGVADFVAWRAGLERFTGPFCNQVDREALEQLHESTNGSDWTNSDGWLTAQALEKWYGIETDSLGRVVTVDLERNGLTGKLVPGLGHLRELIRLRIGTNALSGRLPLSLAQLSLVQFDYADTDLCAPAADAFREWLDGVASLEGTGTVCDPVSDREILEVLYLATNGTNWTNNEGWFTDRPLREWHGVEVDDQGRIESLSLSGNGLSGSIPPELGNLSSLAFLSLGDNGLIGRIPVEIGALENLLELSLSYNELSGEIPPELGDLGSLLYLDLGYNGLIGGIPVEVGGLENLQQLYLHGNDLTGEIPPELATLRNLNTLWLSNNKLSGPVPAGLGSLAELNWVSLSGNELTGDVPPELGNLDNLFALDLHNNELTGGIPSELGNLSSLERLRLEDNDLWGPVPTEFAGMSSLKELRLSQNRRMRGALPAELTRLSHMESLLAAGTDLCWPSVPGFQTWLGQIRTKRIARCGDGSGPIVYLTQAVQSPQHPVPLVAGRKAMLRVFPVTDSASDEGIPAVRARFFVDGREVYVKNLPRKFAPIPTEVDESSVPTSANAEIPAEVVQRGLEMVIEIDPEGTLDPGLGVAKRIPAVGRLPVDVRAMPDFDLTLLPFVWRETQDSSIVDLVEAMAADPAGHVMFSDTRALLPIGEFVVTAHEPVISSSNNVRQLLSQTEAIRVMEGGAGHYLGMMSPPTTGGFAGYAYIAGRSSYSIPSPDFSYLKDGIGLCRLLSLVVPAT